MEETINEPIYVLRGENYLRYLSIFLLTGIIMLGIYSIQFMGLVMILLAISGIIGLIYIRFPFLSLYEDHFVIEKKGIIKKYNDKEFYRYAEIKQIEFEKGYMNWTQMLVQTIFGQGGYGGFSKPDQMILKYENGVEKTIYRFGSKKDFDFVVNKLQKEIRPR